MEGELTMTIMTRAEAREEQHYESVRHLIPDPEALARGLMEDYSIPAEFEDMGFDDKDDVAEQIEAEVVEEIEAAPVPRDAKHFVEREVEEAKFMVHALVMEEFEVPEEVA